MSVSPARGSVSAFLPACRARVRTPGSPRRRPGCCVPTQPCCGTAALTGRFQQQNVSPASPNATDVENIQCVKSTMKANAIYFLYRLEHLILSVPGAGMLGKSGCMVLALWGGVPCSLGTSAAKCSEHLQTMRVTQLFPEQNVLFFILDSAACSLLCTFAIVRGFLLLKLLRRSTWKPQKPWGMGLCPGRRGG